MELVPVEVGTVGVRGSIPSIPGSLAKNVDGTRHQTDVPCLPLLPQSLHL